MELNPIVDLDEQEKNEENTKLNYITPAIQNKWNQLGDKIVMEYNKITGKTAYYFTDGRVEVNDDDTVSRGKQKKVDYLLLSMENIPLALVEAKGYDHDINDGVQQAIDYARILDVPYAYVSNGHAFHEEDMLNGTNREFGMDDFPTSDELWERYKKYHSISSEQEEILLNPYYISPDGRKPRYYQRIAINKTISAIAKNDKRILLVMATGTGKTFTALQIIYRLWHIKLKKKILFLVDRNALADQTFEAFTPFKKVMCKIGQVLNGKVLDLSTPERANNLTAYQVFISLYHQLKLGEKDNYRNLPPDFFDLIVIDECHRGSADEESNWHDILEYFSSATQIGLTATPKETEYVSNIGYFGNPIYTYSLKQGIEDGFLAPYKVVSVELDIDRDGYIPQLGMVDVDGKPVEQKRYEQKDFDRKIIVQERRELVAKRISDYLKATDRYAKTIVFCETEEHAGAMMNLLKNENSDLVKEDSRYVMRITGNDELGKDQIKNFASPSQKYPVIAVTSKLLSTGIDTQTAEVIVLDKTIGSMTEFKQTIGRGTRIKEHYKIGDKEKSKTHFTILDFRMNYLKFQDPEFDGEPTAAISIDGDKKIDRPEKKKKDLDGDKAKKKTLLKVNGVEVEIVGEEVRYLDEDGNLIKMNIDRCVRNNIKTNYLTYEDFKDAWFKTEKKDELADGLLLTEEFINKIRNEFGFNIDKYDIICFIGYGVNPVSKEERIKKQEVVDYLTTLGDDKKEVVDLLLECYKETDFNDLRLLKIFDLPIFIANGWSKKKAVSCFGGKDKYVKTVDELEKKLY